MNISGRIKKIEAAMEQRGIGQGELKIFFCEGTETEEECMLRNGISEDSPDLNILIFKWGSGTPDGPHHLPDAARATEPKPETIESVNQELETLKAQLKQAEKPKNCTKPGTTTNSSKNNKFNEVNENIDVEPMRVDPFLTGMSR